MRRAGAVRERERGRSWRSASPPAPAAKPALREEVARAGPGWWGVLKRVKAELTDHEAGLLAAGVAFYALLALPFALGAFVSIYGLIADPGQVEQQLAAMSGVLPAGAYELLSAQLQRVVAHSGGALGLSLVISIALALWSASQATKAIMSACNLAYDVEERRGFLRYTAVALGLTAGALVVGVVALAGVAAAPVILDRVGLGGAARVAIQVLRWPLVLALVVAGLAVVYRYAPSERPPESARRWITPGALAATALWLLGSIAFSIYAGTFGGYDQTYGALGAVVVAMLWLWLSAYAVIVGAELDAVLGGPAGEPGR